MIFVFWFRICRRTSRISSRSILRIGLVHELSIGEGRVIRRERCGIDVESNSPVGGRSDRDIGRVVGIADYLFSKRFRIIQTL